LRVESTFLDVCSGFLTGCVSHFIGVVKIDRIRNAHSPVVKCCFLGERGFGVHTKFFCSSYIYGKCWSRIRMMPSWHLWGNWVICKLRRPLPKFHFWVIFIIQD